MVGTTLMLLEASECGAVVHFDQVLLPLKHLSISIVAELSQFWLYSQYSSVTGRKNQCLFRERDLVSKTIGFVDESTTLKLNWNHESKVFGHLATQRLTGFRL